MEAAQQILVRAEGALLRITLNRPEAINALTPAMLQGLDAALDRSLADPAIRAIAIEGAGDRGLCAGGDIKLLAANTAADAEWFWRIEYRVNAASRSIRCRTSRSWTASSWAAASASPATGRCAS